MEIYDDWSAAVRQVAQSSHTRARQLPPHPSSSPHCLRRQCLRHGCEVTPAAVSFLRGHQSLSR
ncbi:hypothetical protein E2C01_069798 [Portunus trituberculatus]|uniref:Uncharacterized protein n=1 Tax=Portunus trituberculatus TaxID=210409 RepID=A0A5B7HR06_PORTR|nr:hypothetical protein [Portunus trituberculatus]